ncbi:ABC transporter type 1 transmembrane domain [Fadolivirus algeromassiliense]|jgi:ABC-type multidrug transport system fused ATPase/permease subunit|uniref:ABC transporter type 1 transmembrane domain n=1 Tax=Fadolivirus FV1/VV64 TaxID=3070911 RepID=A0A7D3UUU9_9VIRU|nr:ABC transporter type 1 transmembrane domain [Fadolivirus algeromassiliense]QKF93749.1 ABC transporter type 1 transmembrane domain [Fadolivirus FV1/VV64]
MSILLNYLNNYKWYIISGIIATNGISQLFKLITYRNLTEFINTIVTLNGSDSYLISFFIKLFLIHAIQDLSKYILEKIIGYGVKDLFKRIVKCIMFNTMEFYKKDIHTKINQIWLYLNNIELMMEKLLIDLPKILVFIGYYIYTIYRMYPNALLFIIPINIFIVFALHPFSKKQYKLQRDRLNYDLDVKNKLLEVTSNIEFVKLNNREDNEIMRIDNAYDRYTLNKIRDKWIGFCIDFISHIFNDFLILVIYSIGIIYIVQKQINPIDLLYLAVNTGNFCMQMMQLKDIYNYYMKINPKLEIIYHIINSKEEKVHDKKIQTYKRNDINSIKFNNITFSYDNIVNVIKDTSFEFKGNKINLLLGPNGSGKTTLIKLLLRIYELKNTNDDKNKICLDDIDIKQLSLNELRKRIVYVSQEPYIFNESVLYNIKYGTETVSDTKLMELCDILYSRNWLIENKDKSAGFRGRNLSGGERKKIQLINAICRDSEIIVFDEPTNTLDNNALLWFNEFIKLIRDKYNKTIIIITHDIRLKDVSDHIVDLTNK